MCRVCVCVLYIVLLNCHVMFELPKKLGLSAGLSSPISYSSMLFSKYPSSPLGWVWVLLITPRGVTKQPKNKTLCPQNSWKVSHFQRMLLLFIPWHKIACNGKVQPWEAQHGENSHVEICLSQHPLWLLLFESPLWQYYLYLLLLVLLLGSLTWENTLWFCTPCCQSTGGLKGVSPVKFVWMFLFVCFWMPNLVTFCCL